MGLDGRYLSLNYDVNHYIVFEASVDEFVL